MKLLKKAENQMAFGKVGILGFQGSGKSYTAALIAVGVCQMVGNNKVAFFDTETGSDFLIPLFKEKGIELFTFKGRAFSDLVTFVKECEAEGICVAIIDSVTHVWRNLVDSYMQKKNISRMEFQHWGKVKGPGGWQDFTDVFVNSNLHIIICGRAGFEYDYDINEDGSKDLVKTGTKMKAEGEFGFEPSLVIEMERRSPAKDELEKIHDSDKTIQQKRKAKESIAPKIGSKWIHRAYVLKDRTDTINGQEFDYPTFDSFKPHFDKLNIGGQHFGFDADRNSTDRFDDDGLTRWHKDQKRKAVALDEIQSNLVLIWPGTTKEEKLAKGLVIKEIFGNPSWKHVETNVSVPMLEDASASVQLLSIRWPEMMTDEAFKGLALEKQISMAIGIVREEMAKESKPPMEDDIPM